MKNKIGVIILLILPFLIMFIAEISNSKKESAIDDFGNYFFSTVERKIPLGNQGSNKLRHYVYINNKKTNLTDYITIDYYSEIAVGDTILIKAIISDTLTWSVLQEDKKHLIPCLKEYNQPPNGWKELPVKECEQK